ncbi:MAG: hypothetical protein JSS30_02245 [Verrucomicrobia bacterium]|nr:hypothetical protein [Verrucomicrobiota bacterium]
MTRLSKQTERRMVSPRRTKAPQPKTGPKKDNLPGGYKKHANAIEGEMAKAVFIPKIK